MSKDKKTLSEKVFDLIKSLSKTERRKVLSSNELSENAKRKSQKSYLKLFKIYASLPKYNSVQVLKKFGGDKSSFKVANAYLRTVILENLAAENSKGQNILAVAQKAKEKGFPKYGKQLLIREIDRKLAKGEKSDLLGVFEELETLNKYHLDSGYSADSKSKEESFYKELAAFSRSKLLYARFKECLGGSAEEMLEAHEAGKEEMELLSRGFYQPQTQYQILKTAQLFFRIGMDFEKASAMQAKALLLIQENEGSFDIEKLVTETHIRVLFLINKGELEEARGMLTDLGAKDYPSYVENLLNRYWVADSIYLAAAAGDLDYIPRAIKDFGKYSHLLSPMEKLRLSHAISVLYFMKGDWANTILWQGKVSSMPNKNDRRYTWLPYLVKSICLFEQGYFYRAKSTAKKYFEFDPNGGFVYPSLVLNALQRILENTDNIIGTRKILVYLSEECAKLMETNLEFQSESLGFVLTYWLKAKIQKKSIRQIISEDSQTGTPLFLLA